MAGAEGAEPNGNGSAAGAAGAAGGCFAAAAEECFFDDVPCPEDLDGEGAGEEEGEGEGDGFGSRPPTIGRLGSTEPSPEPEDDDLDGDGLGVGSKFGSVGSAVGRIPESRPGVVDAWATVGESSETAIVTAAVPVTSGTERTTADFHAGLLRAVLD